MVFGSGSRKKLATPSLGYKTGFSEQYEVLQQLGKGGNGVVRLARHKASGEAQREGRRLPPPPPARRRLLPFAACLPSTPPCTVQAAALRSRPSPRC